MSFCCKTLLVNTLRSTGVAVPTTSATEQRSEDGLWEALHRQLRNVSDVSMWSFGCYGMRKETAF